MRNNRTLERLHAELRWPTPECIFNPPGVVPSRLAQLARRKIESPLRLNSKSQNLEVGVLARNPSAKDVDALVAILCLTSNPLSPTILDELHRLSWNFHRSPLLITIEPHLIRAWSCYEKPRTDDTDGPLIPVERASIDSLNQMVGKFHWHNLVTDQLLDANKNRFPQDQCVDETLLANLSYVRHLLMENLDEDIVHDLLARLIFIQFLFQRKDSEGNSALSGRTLTKLSSQGVLDKEYCDLSEILRSKRDTYSLFRWLDEIFNGDLFPLSWSKEEKEVKRKHLDLLADFVSGKLKFKNGQLTFWSLYSFDTIPLELISSIYEVFVKDPSKTRTGTHYTPDYVVDFMLDKILPWESTDYDVKLLDPACGSGIFLVKAFQRLVHRWKRAHPNQEPPIKFIRSLLERNLFGIDVEAHAVRVASFSLYLAMCDEIDPKHYWTRIRFPRLREVTLKTADFFADNSANTSVNSQSKGFDYVIGNPPWGKKSLSSAAKEWASNNDWETANEQYGVLFLAKAAQMTRTKGQICLIQPTGPLLYHQSPTAIRARKKVFREHMVHEIVNLSALRFRRLFRHVVGPTCIIVASPEMPSQEPIPYWCPKRTSRIGDRNRIVIDHYDLNWVFPEEAQTDPTVWSALTLGGRRDLELLKDLKNRCPLLGSFVESNNWFLGRGFQRGSKAAKLKSNLNHLPIQESHRKWISGKNVVSVSEFPTNANPKFERARNLETFSLPMLLIQESWRVGGFECVIVTPGRQKKYLLFSNSYLGMRAPRIDSLATVATIIRSKVGQYLLYLTGGRLAQYRPTLQEADLKNLPLPKIDGVVLDEFRQMTQDEIDIRGFELYGLTKVQRELIEDFVRFTIPGFRRPHETHGQDSVTDNLHLSLHSYCEYFISVIKDGFGEDKSINATVYCAQHPGVFPFCIASFELGTGGETHIQIESLDSYGLHKKLAKLEELYMEMQQVSGGFIYRRVARIYEYCAKGTRERSKVPTVFLIKPDECRYWTRSMALRDADDVAADILLAHQ